MATNAMLLLVAGVVLMLALHILVVLWAIRRGVELRSLGEPRDEEEERAVGLTARELSELPCQDFKPPPPAAGIGGDCAVCLEAFQAGDRCRVLPRCGHGFHAQCVDSWLRKSRLCPVCRAEAAAPAKAADEAATSEIIADTFS